MFSLEVLEVAIYALAALVRALGWLFVLLCSILVFAIGVTRSSQGCFLLGFLTTVDIATRDTDRGPGWADQNVRSQGTVPPTHAWASLACLSLWMRSV